MSEDEITLVCHALVKARDGLLSERATGLPMLSQYRDDAFVLVEKALQTASHALAALAQPPAPTAQPAESTTGQPLRSICWANCPCRKTAKPVQQPGADVHWCATWLRNNYQDHPSISGLCDAMKEAAHQAAPAQRQPLSDEQLDMLAFEAGGLPNSHLEFARAIEAAHGIAAQKGEKL